MHFQHCHPAIRRAYRMIDETCSAEMRHFRSWWS